MFPNTDEFKSDFTVLLFPDTTEFFTLNSCELIVSELVVFISPVTTDEIVFVTLLSLPVTAFSEEPCTLLFAPVTTLLFALPFKVLDSPDTFELLEPLTVLDSPDTFELLTLRISLLLPVTTPPFKVLTVCDSPDISLFLVA